MKGLHCLRLWEIQPVRALDYGAFGAMWSSPSAKKKNN